MARSEFNRIFKNTQEVWKQLQTMSSEKQMSIRSRCVDYLSIKKSQEHLKRKKKNADLRSNNPLLDQLQCDQRDT